jgi:hypothetical protein
METPFKILCKRMNITIIFYVILYSQCINISIFGKDEKNCELFECASFHYAFVTANFDYNGYFFSKGNFIEMRSNLGSLVNF